MQTDDRFHLPYVKVKYPYRTDVRWAFLKWGDIPDTEDPKRVYLRRLRIFQTPWFAFYLHFIYLPDDQAPHDHPCNFWSLILRGGYTERFYRDPGLFERSRFYGPSSPETFTVRNWTRWTVHGTPTSAAHRITVLEPRTISLCLFGRRRRDWGFWTQDGFVPQKVYREAKRAS